MLFRSIEDKAAELMLEDRLGKGDSVSARLEDGKIVLTKENK